MIVKRNIEKSINDNILEMNFKRSLIEGCKIPYETTVEYKDKIFTQMDIELEKIIIRIDKPFMYRNSNFLFKMYKLIESQNLLYDYVAPGLDNISIVFSPVQLSNTQQEELMKKLYKEIKPYQVCTVKNIVSLKFTFNNRKLYSEGLKYYLGILKEADVIIEVMIQNLSARNFIICFRTSYIKNIVRILNKDPLTRNFSEWRRST